MFVTNELKNYMTDLKNPFTIRMLRYSPSNISYIYYQKKLWVPTEQENKRRRCGSTQRSGQRDEGRDTKVRERGEHIQVA